MIKKFVNLVYSVFHYKTFIKTIPGGWCTICEQFIRDTTVAYANNLRS